MTFLYLYVGVGCPSGWVEAFNACYTVVTTHSDFDSAQSECELRGAHLAVAEFEEELDFIRNLAR